jgi:hypothetical protein
MNKELLRSKLIGHGSFNADCVDYLMSCIPEEEYKEWLDGLNQQERPEEEPREEMPDVC